MERGVSGHHGQDVTKAVKEGRDHGIGSAITRSLPTEERPAQARRFKRRAATQKVVLVIVNDFIISVMTWTPFHNSKLFASSYNGYCFPDGTFKIQSVC